MSDTDDPALDDTALDDTALDDTALDDTALDDFRDAAGAVIESLKQLIDATERVVADPAAFASAVDGGRSIVEAFVGGFTAQADPDGTRDESEDTAANAEGGESAPES